MAKFRALPVTKDGDRQSIAATELTDADLVEGNVSIAVEHSTVTHRGSPCDNLIRKFPLIPGIDLVGRVLARRPALPSGRSVVLNGYGLGEVHHGGSPSGPRSGVSGLSDS